MSGVRRNPVQRNTRRTFVSARTILIVRFDPGTTDDYDPDEIREEVDPDPYIASRRKQRFERLLDQSQATGPLAFDRADFRAALSAAKVNLADAVSKLPRPDGLTRILDLQPQSSTRSINTYRKADELTLAFSWREAPFDARLIRSILILHYEGTVTADAWSTGIREQAPDNPEPTGFIVPATGANLRFVGLADMVSDAHGDGGDILNIKARDLTSLLIDTKYPPKLGVRIPPRATIQEVVRNILDTNDVFELIRGPFLRIDGSLPQLDSARYSRLAVTAKERHRQDDTGGQPFVLRRPPKGAGGKASYWDTITELCVSHGLRPAIEGDLLVLMEPRTLYKRTPEIVTQPGVPTFPTAYRRSLGDGSTVRRMVYGHNVAALRFHRKLSRIKAPVVQVVSSNPDARTASERLIAVRHPPQTTGRRANDVDSSGRKPQEKFHRVAVSGIIDRSILLSIARQVYEGMGRQELGVVIETDDLASFSTAPGFDPNEDPDLLAIRAGDPIRLLVSSDAGDLFTLSELQRIINKARQFTDGSSAPESAVAFLQRQGWERGNAEQFARILASANLPQEFRVVSASVSFSSDSGFNIQLDCRDYIRARADPEDPGQTREIGAALPGGEVVA